MEFAPPPARSFNRDADTMRTTQARRPIRRKMVLSRSLLTARDTKASLQGICSATACHYCAGKGATGCPLLLSFVSLMVVKVRLACHSEFCRVIAASDLLTETPIRVHAGKSPWTPGRQTVAFGVNDSTAGQSCELADKTWCRLGRSEC